MNDINIYELLELKSIELFKFKKVLKEMGLLEYIEAKVKDLEI